MRELVGKRQKLLKKILSGSKNIWFDEFVALLEAFNFMLKRMRGSHRVYKHPQIPDLLSIQPDQNGQAKLYQMNQLVKLIEEYNLTLEDAEADEERDE